MSATKSPTHKEIAQVRRIVRQYAEANPQPVTMEATAERETRDEQLEKLDSRIAQQNIEANEQTIQALVDMVSKNRRLESLIVTNYLSRTRRYMVDADEYDNQLHLNRKARHV